jgi:hypothetical protein
MRGQEGCESVENMSELKCPIYNRVFKDDDLWRRWKLGFEDLALKLYDAGFHIIPMGEGGKPLAFWEQGLDREEFIKLQSRASGNAIVGGSGNPFGEKVNLLLTVISRPSILENAALLRRFIEGTVHWKAEPICPNCEEGDLEVLKPEKRFRCKECLREFTIDEAERMLVAIFFIDRGILTESKKIGGINLLIDNYVLIPPSIHSTGVRYEFIRGFDFSKKNFGILYLDGNDFRAILNDIENVSLEVSETKPVQKVEDRLGVVKLQTYKCGLCKKFHTMDCPAETVNSIREKIYFQNEDSKPIAEDCFELDPWKLKTTLSSTTLPPASEIGETFTYTGDRPFKGRVQVGALTTPFSRFTHLLFKCRDPGECRVNDCPLNEGFILSVDDDGSFDPSAFATYFDTNNPMDALNVYAEKYNFSRCAEWRKKITYCGWDERAVTGALVYDLTGQEGRAWFIHGELCDLRRAPNWIIAEGWLCRGYKGRIGVLIQAFRSESEVMAPSDEEVKKARALLKTLVDANKGLEGSAVWRLAEVLRRKVNAKGGEVRKGFAADLLHIASPVWVKTPETADKELGATIVELGPSTNFKSQRERLLVKWIGAGKYLCGRITEAGLTAGLEKIEGLGWVVKKGALPSADLSFIIVDNAQPNALDKQIESRRNGIVSIAGIKSMEMWARTRLKLLNNPQRPLDELVYKCVALKMFDSKLIARMTFAIYTYGISVDERYDPTISSLTAEEEAILEAARTVLRWNLSQEVTYTVPLSLWPKIMEYSKQLELKYGCEDIPLLLRNIPYKLAVVAYGFALLEGEAEPSERHYRLAYEWLDFCAKDIELDKYAEVQKALRNLSDEEYEKIRKAIEEEIERDVNAYGGEREDSHLYRFLEYLVKHEVARCDELAAHLEVDERTVKRKAQLLKGLGLLRSGKDGYTLTSKGVRFIKKWLPLVLDAPNVTTSKGEGSAKEYSADTCISPKSGDIKDIGDMDKSL